jgi:cobalt-zinc-cadmium efflux system outer membrane protein
VSRSVFRRSTWRRALGAAGLSLALAPALHAADGETVAPRRLTLKQALAEAFALSPALNARRAAVDEARGRLVSADTFRFNPELEGAVADRRTPVGSVTDYGFGLSQELEIGGQRGMRADTATARLAAAQAAFLRDRRLLAARVELAFADAVWFRERFRVEERDAELTRRFLDLSQKRLEAGATSQLDVNLARAAHGRALRRVEQARAAAFEARSLLAEAIGLDPSIPPLPAGELPEPSPEPLPLEALVRQAAASRTDLEALRQSRLAAEARLRLAHAERIPNLRLRGFYDREEGTDRIFGGQVAISLPLFNRNQGGIAEARAALERSGHERSAFELTVQREVAAAHARLQAAVATTEQLRGQVMGSLEESLGLLERSFSAGKIGAMELLVFRREFVESERDYVGVLADAWRARIELDLAAGRLSVPAFDTES